MNELPELPTPYTRLPGAWDTPIFTADQMKAYALSAVQAERDRRHLLEAFFREVAELTIEHDVLPGKSDEDDGYAVVYPSKLGKALEKVDINWHGWGAAAIRSPAKE